MEKSLLVLKNIQQPIDYTVTVRFMMTATQATSRGLYANRATKLCSKTIL